VKKSSTLQRIKVKGSTTKRPQTKSETVYFVVWHKECRESGARVEHTIGVFKHKEVAEFRANGAMMFAEKGNTDRVFVREQEMICEETPNEFLTNRLPH
jgi:hypothetical protein